MQIDKLKASLLEVFEKPNPTIEDVYKAIDDYNHFINRTIPAKKVIEVVCNITGVTYEELKQRKNIRKHVATRWVIYYCLNKSKLEISNSAMGRMFGQDHSTVCNSLSKIEDYLSTNDVLLVETLKEAQIQLNMLP